MKQYAQILLNIILFLFIGTIISCNDAFMERWPLGRISEVNYWKTSGEIKLFANQFYYYLQPTNSPYYADNGSDNQLPRNRWSYIWNEVPVPATGGGWSTNDWRRINICNYALSRIGDRDNKDNDFLRYEGEIRFFKTKFYFDKIKTFGDVPWLERDLNIDSEELYAPRMSRLELIPKILDDLDFAIKYLPSKDDNRRVTKYAALALKSEICLYEGTFRKYHELGDFEPLLLKAAEAAEAIMNSGEFAVYSTGDKMNDYFNLFIQEDLGENSEAILYKAFEEDIIMHNLSRQMTQSQTGFSKAYADSYLCTDGKPISVSPLFRGDDIYRDQFINRDPRMEQTIYPGNPRVYAYLASGQASYKTAPQFETNYTTSGYEIFKYNSPYPKDQIQNKNTIDQHIFRYGRILLNYAEAKAELGTCTQRDLNISINLLRDRVEMPHLVVDVGFDDPDWPNWEVPVSPLINEIRRERRIELGAEGNRWDDLVRWKAGKLLENENTLLGARNPNTGNYHVQYPGYQRKWSDKLYLNPIPYQELVLNKNLVQNPGWE